jgi:hypothetical protein
VVPVRAEDAAAEAEIDRPGDPTTARLITIRGALRCVDGADPLFPQNALTSASGDFAWPTPVSTF